MMRLNMVTERVKDPTEVQADVQLQYTYDGVGGIEPMAQITVPEPTGEMSQETMVSQPAVEYPQQPVSPPPQPIMAQAEQEPTPIMRASRDISSLTDSPIARQAKESAIKVGV